MASATSTLPATSTGKTSPKPLRKSVSEFTGIHPPKNPENLMSTESTVLTQSTSQNYDDSSVNSATPSNIDGSISNKGLSSATPAPIPPPPAPRIKKRQTPTFASHSESIVSDSPNEPSIGANTTAITPQHQQKRLKQANLPSSATHNSSQVTKISAGESTSTAPDAPAAIGAAAPSSSTTYPGREGLSAKEIRRLERNRLSARECRRRKKQETENLEQEILLLEKENLRLRLQLQIGQEAEEYSHLEQNKLIENMDDLLKSGASESEINASIEEFKQKYADYGRDRRSAIEFHLRNVERLLMPTKTTSIAMRALKGGTTSNMATDSNDCNQDSESEIQDAKSDSENDEQKSAKSESSSNEITSALPDSKSDTKNEDTSDQKPQPASQEDSDARTPSTSSALEAESGPTADVGVSHQSSPASTNSEESPQPTNTFDSRPGRPSTEPKALFQFLVNHLEVTPEQASELKDSRMVAKELDDVLAESLAMLKELRDTITKCGDDLNAEFTNVRQILTPTQAAKFLVWVSNNEACMHMLNELWKRVYSCSEEASDDIM